MCTGVQNFFFQLNFYFLQEDIRGKYSEQKHLAKINLLEQRFSKK